jgi:hypothetical protein
MGRGDGRQVIEQEYQARRADYMGVDMGDEIGGVNLRHLAPLTILVVRTVNSSYRVTITWEPEVLVQGGTVFPDPTTAHLDGASIGRSVKLGWIGVGLRMEFRSAGRRIITSPVRDITIEPPRLEPSTPWLSRKPDTGATAAAGNETGREDG